MFFLDARNHALFFDTTGNMSCLHDITAADKVARVCKTKITKTVNIVLSKESYF